MHYTSIEQMLQMASGGTVSGREPTSIKDAVMDSKSGDGPQIAMAKQNLFEAMRDATKREELEQPRPTSLTEAELTELSTGQVDHVLGSIRKKLVKRAKNGRSGSMKNIANYARQVIMNLGESVDVPSTDDPVTETIALIEALIAESAHHAVRAKWKSLYFEGLKKHGKHSAAADHAWHGIKGHLKESVAEAIDHLINVVVAEENTKPGDMNQGSYATQKPRTLKSGYSTGEFTFKEGGAAKQAAELKPAKHRGVDAGDPIGESKESGLTCPECGEKARPGKVKRTGSMLSVDPARLQHVHHDGEPLCPVMTSKGYQPALPKKQSAESIGEWTETDKNKPCPLCEGAGKHKDKKCPRCAGKGTFHEPGGELGKRAHEARAFNAKGFNVANESADIAEAGIARLVRTGKITAGPHEDPEMAKAGYKQVHYAPGQAQYRQKQQVTRGNIRNKRLAAAGASAPTTAPQVQAASADFYDEAAMSDSENKTGAKAAGEKKFDKVWDDVESEASRIAGVAGKTGCKPPLKEAIAAFQETVSLSDALQEYNTTAGKVTGQKVYTDPVETMKVNSAYRTELLKLSAGKGKIAGAPGKAKARDVKPGDPIGE